MNKRIHKFISSFFKGFVPIIYMIFILAGIISALVSGLIEYEVFSELYKKSIGDSSWLIFSVPFLVVISFEIVKIFLIFLNKQADISANSHYRKDKKHFLNLRYILIFVSFLSTLIYSFYNLQNPEYENLLEQKKTELTSKFELDKDAIVDTYDSQLEIQTKEIDAQIALYDGRMVTEEDFKFSGRQEFRGPRFEEAKRNKEAQEKRRNEIINNVNNNRNIKIGELSAKLEADKLKAEDNLNKSNIAGNKMLKATLGTFKKNFPEWSYILIVLLLSLILSIGLEYIIWASFTVLAMNHGEIFDFGIQAGKYENATETEIKMNQADANKETQTIANLARSIVNTVKDKSNDLFRRRKNDIRNNK